MPIPPGGRLPTRPRQRPPCRIACASPGLAGDPHGQRIHRTGVPVVQCRERSWHRPPSSSAPPTIAVMRRRTPGGSLAGSEGASSRNDHDSIRTAVLRRERDGGQEAGSLRRRRRTTSSQDRGMAERRASEAFRGAGDESDSGGDSVPVTEQDDETTRVSGEWVGCAVLIAAFSRTEAFAALPPRQELSERIRGCARDDLRRFRYRRRLADQHHPRG